MKIRLKIGLYVFFSMGWCLLQAQTGEGKLLSVSNKLLLNPSYAGLNKSTRIWTGMQFFSPSKNEINNLYFLTYDSYSEKLKGGIAWYFYQGLTGKANTSDTGAGLAYSKTINSGNAGKIIPSLNINYIVSTKQWFVYTIDNLISKQYEPPNPPGQEYLRYHTFLTRSGILWESRSHQIGLSASLPLRKSLTAQKKYNGILSPRLIFQVTKKIEGTKGGLVSQPVKTKPELIILYSGNMLLTRAGIRKEFTDHIYGLFAQSNFTENLHGILGTIGWNIKNISLNISTGCSYSISSQKITFSGETTIGIVIPYIHHEKDDPWKPSPNMY